MPDKFKITFSEAWDIFFETDVKPRTEYSTQTHYYRDKMRIIPYVADSKLCRIREETWVRIIEDWHRKGKAGQKCALSGLGRIRMLYRFWGLELDWNKVRPKLDRPVKKVKVDADGNLHVDRRAFSDDEKQRMLESAKEYDNQPKWKSKSNWYAIFLILFQSGLRRGELLALTWKDVDLENKVIHVRKTIKKGVIDGVFVESVGKPKNIQSIRSVPISDESVGLLRAIKSDAVDYDSTSIVFRNVTRKRKYKYEWISGNNIEYAWKRILHLAGLDEELSIHCTRHTWATKLILAGVDLSTIQRMGGWKNANILLSVYGHTTRQAEKEALEKCIF